MGQTRGRVLSERVAANCAGSCARYWQRSGATDTPTTASRRQGRGMTCRTWQVERRKRTRHLIELGGLVVKAGLVDLTKDDRATIYGMLRWAANTLQGDQGERALALWAAKGKQAFEADTATHKRIGRTASAIRR
jgi:hypothetical protein